MAVINEVRYSNAKTIIELPCGTIFKYKDIWFLRSDIYVPNYTKDFNLLGEYTRNVFKYIHYNAVDLVTGEVAIDDSIGCHGHPEAIANEIDVKMKI